MSAHTFTSPRPRRSLARLAALDFGLPVHVRRHCDQRSLFSGVEDLSLRELLSELAQMVSGLRVRSFTLRAELEEVTSALLDNVECGFIPLARRAAYDLGGLLDHAGRRRLADAELCVLGARCAFRIRELLVNEER